MGRRSHKRLGLIVLAGVALVAHLASGATLNKRARLRQGPSKDTTLLGWIEQGTAVTLEGEQRGWYAVRAPDGQTGYIWREHLDFSSGEQAPPSTAAVATTTAPAPTTLPPAPPPSPAPPAAPSASAPPGPAPAATAPDAVASEIERLRVEVTRLSTLQQELTERLGKGAGSTSSSPIASDGSAGAAATFLLAGAFIGLVLGYVIRGRRDRRSRIRL